MTDEDDKTNITQKLVMSKFDLGHITNDFSAMQVAMFDSPAMRAIEEESKRLQKITDSITGMYSSTATSALFQGSEILRVSRIAEEAMANMHGISSAAAAMAINFPAVDSLASQYAELFRNPYHSELDKVAETARQALGTSNLTSAKFQIQCDEIRKVAESIHSPWINSQNVLASIQGIEGLSSIGKVLRESIHPFEKSTTHFLRDQLGDWRWASASTSALLDPIQRSEFYVDKGLNPLLINYPSDAFDEAISATGIRPEIRESFAPGYQRPSETVTSDDEPATHMVEAFKTIYAFESRIRRFINEIMSEKYGPNWARHRVHGDLKREWEEKRNKALESGEPEHPLICYADFTHYETIIVRKDNWEEVFKAVFRNKESVAESFRRLYPMRIPTMHSRIIVSDDMLYLFAETRRLLRAMEAYSKIRHIN